MKLAIYQLLIMLFITFYSFSLSAQVSINTDNTNPDPSAMLDIKSIDKGVLIPRMNYWQRNDIINPAKGLLVFDTSSDGFWYFDGSQWLAISSAKQLVDTDGDTKVQIEKNPDEDKIRFDVAGSEFGYMDGKTLHLEAPGGSLFIGENAGLNDDGILNNNTFIGVKNGMSNQSGSRNTAIGFESLRSNVYGAKNTVNGYWALFHNSSGDNNTAIGHQSLYNNNGNNNTAIGYNSLVANQMGSDNTAVGMWALEFNTDGIRNTALGYSSLSSNTMGGYNTAIGVHALHLNDSGGHNTAIGRSALLSNTTGNKNTAIGFGADVSSGNLSNATAIGAQAYVSSNNSLVLGSVAGENGASNDTYVGIGTTSPDTKLHLLGELKIQDGSQANGYVLTSNSDGLASWQPSNGATSNVVRDGDFDTMIQVEESADEDKIRFDVAGMEVGYLDQKTLHLAGPGNNLFIGREAGVNNNGGTVNTFIGVRAGEANSSGSRNTAIGFEALNLNTTGEKNTANGYQTLFKNTTGQYNTANGYYALRHNTIGVNNTANGYLSMYLNTSGNYNTATGVLALHVNSTGSNNTAIGYESLYANSTGIRNTANGYKALYSNTTGNNNTATGTWALELNTSGLRNTAIGYLALSDNTTGDSNTAIGGYAFSNGANYTNSTALGYGAEPGASHTVKIGNSTVSTIGGAANWTSDSDARFKTNVQENVVGLDFIMKLRPVTYQMDMDAIARFCNIPDSIRSVEGEQLKAAELQTGFIAQEVEAAAEAAGYDFHGVDKPKNETSHYGLRYAEFVVPLTKATQEQQTVIEELRKENTTLKDQMDSLEKRLQELESLLLKSK